MSTLTEIQAQIADLQKQAQEIINIERKAILEDIKAKMAAYNITMEELERKGKAVKSAPRSPSPIKYKKSETEYWVGRGPKPQWVKGIESNGENIEIYRVQE
ncbi:H-NS histone family protein [Pelodictyon phaeoclathratiforme]|jgi:DNA-binding protein H-NS|uniref:Histone-like nucleoid-structuring protein H-NS n=1 Tax=Pelodictyon phaeoclathratiforme (strain DSM 5477 / BU-1) TaxID=324925 RepID=B4SG34_PELPB|nr:H-NS histone family protein [Pelodictyon phaeoclathratiforme]ACF43345.1 histone-like nucleoid-structuring protein H-NS [Pelodictyon phaeoclathratiforme BU-1]MBV5290621.1 H-NS histone family protein [Pelodictyon phaeoclathratiforme]